jgi:hypothetical protein
MIHLSHIKKTMQALSIAIVLFSVTACSVYYPIPLRKEHHIVSTFVPNDLELYKKLLPAQFEMPETPLVKLDFVQVNPNWHECYVSIKAKYKGQHTWHALTWAIDTYVPYKLGRYAGYPKFMADSMNYNLGETEAKQWVIKNKQLFMSMKFSKDNEQTHNYSASQWANEEVYHLFAPPLTGNKMNKLTFTFLRKPKAYDEQQGKVQVQFNESEPWAKLIADGNNTIVNGIYFKRKQKRILFLRSKRVK